MKKSDTPKNPIIKILAVIQVFLILAFVFIAISELPPIWRASGSVGVVSGNASGGKDVPIYKMSLGLQDTVKDLFKSSGLSSDAKLAQSYITANLEAATFSYIEEYGYQSDISYKVLSSTKDEFRYSINGSPTGESWQVWVCIADRNNPLVTVFKGDA